MSEVTHDEIRLQILEFLYRFEKDAPSTWGVDRATLQRELGISERDMDYDMTFLSQRALVTTIQAENVLWYLARLSRYGRDVVENKKLYERQFPFLRYAKPKK